MLVAHGAHFEIAIERHILGPQHGFPIIPLERQICTQAMSLSLGLPARLDLIAKTLELGHRKDSAGERLMHMMSKPRKPHKDEAPGTYWFDDEERLRAALLVLQTRHRNRARDLQPVACVASSRNGHYGY